MNTVGSSAGSSDRNRGQLLWRPSLATPIKITKVSTSAYLAHAWVSSDSMPGHDRHTAGHTSEGHGHPGRRRHTQGRADAGNDFNCDSGLG